MKNKKGMTFIEVLIAIVIAGMILPVMLVCLNFADRYIRNNSNKTMALNYAQGLMEEIEDTGYGGLNDYNEYADTVQMHQAEGANIQAVRSAEVTEDDDPDNDIFKKITVTVSWNWFGRPYIEEVNTLRYNY